MNNYDEIKSFSIVQLAYFLEGVGNSKDCFDNYEDILDWLTEESALSRIRKKTLGEEI